MLLAPTRISSIGALNQRSTAVNTTRLPTINTSTAGITVMPSSDNTSLARKRPKGSPLRPSMIDVMTLRASTNASATSIVTLVTDSAIKTTSVRKSGDSIDVRSASHTMPPSTASRMTMPARISGGLSRNGRRAGVAGLATGSDTELSFAVDTTRLLLVSLQGADIVREVIDVQEVEVNRSETNVDVVI